MIDSITYEVWCVRTSTGDAAEYCQANDLEKVDAITLAEELNTAEPQARFIPVAVKREAI